MQGSREKCIRINIGEAQMLHYNIWSGRPTCSVLASGEIPKDSLVRSSLANKEEVVRR